MQYRAYNEKEDKIPTPGYYYDQKNGVELTAEILRIFIKRVEVGERAEKYSRTATQEVRISYHDIGLLQSMVEAAAEAIPDEVT